MTETTVSVRMGEDIRNQMRLHDEVNWSAVIRNSVVEKLDELDAIDVKMAKKASEEIDIMRAKYKFVKGKTTTEIIREWRDKRK